MALVLTRRTRRSAAACHLFSENTPTLRLTNVAPVVQTEEFHTALFRKSPVGGTIVKLQLSALVCEAPEAARVVSEAGEVLSQAARRGAYEAITGRVGDVVLSGSAKETKTPSTLASENGSREEGSSVRDHALEAPDLARDMHAQFALSGMAADAGGYGSFGRSHAGTPTRPRARVRTPLAWRSDRRTRLSRQRQSAIAMRLASR